MPWVPTSTKLNRLKLCLVVTIDNISYTQIVEQAWYEAQKGKQQ